MCRQAWDVPPEAGRYVGVQGEAEAAQEDGPDNFYLCDCTDYGAPVVRVDPVPLFVCLVWWQGGLPCDGVPEAVGEDAEQVGGELVVCLRWEAVVAGGFVFPETVDGPPDFVDGEGALFQLSSLGVVEDLREAVDFGLGVRVQYVFGGACVDRGSCLGWLGAQWLGRW